jgi:hypothetical protein
MSIDFAQGNYTYAVHWLKMCREFSDANIECGVSLVRLYLAYGQLGAAVAEVNSLLKLERQFRSMLNYIYPYDFYQPTVAIEVFGTMMLTMEKSTDTATLRSHAKYLLLMVRKFRSVLAMSTLLKSDCLFS